MAIGIVSYGLYLPDRVESAEEIAARCGMTVDALHALGIRQRCLPSDDDQPVTMAVKAAQKALESADNLDPMQVDVVIWTGEEYKDYIAQTPSIRLQEETGCKNAWAFDLVAQSVTLIQGLRVARDLIAGDDSIQTVLLAGGTRNIDLVDCQNPDTRFLLPCSASGGAMIIRRDHGRNTLLDTAFLVDAEMADEVYVPGGGTEKPFSPENLNTEVMYFQTPRPEKVAGYLKQRWAAALGDTALRLEANDNTQYLALRHLAPSDRKKVLETLGLASRQSIDLGDYGHHGTNDPLISLDLGLKQHAVKGGDIVTLLTGGIGFTYAAASVLWGKQPV
jgi:3-oxoacyl-[acyl-carrier-protein] synthase-3